MGSDTVGLAGFERYRGLIDDPAAFRAALDRPLPVCIWANPSRVSPAALEASLRAAGLELEPLAWLEGAYRLVSEDSAPGNRLEYMAGLYHVQEEVSLLPVELLAPRPGERILDLCAAPGNKTAQIALRVGTTGCVVANDRNFGRMSVLRRALDRLGVTNYVTTHHDGANYPREAGSFDRVLADVPCSCEGTSRKFPSHIDRPRPVAPGALAGLQFALLRKATQLCRVGGRIVYSTCTYAPEENEMIVDRVLRGAPAGSLRLRPARVEGFRSAPGLTHWDGTRLAEDLHLALRAYPHHNDTGGFFVAVLDKVGPVGNDAEDSSLPLPDEERQPWLDQVLERYDLPPEVFAGQRILRSNGRRLSLAAAGLRPPARPRLETLGMSFLHTQMAVPKPTTEAALFFGAAARRNAVELDRAETDAFFQRRDLPLPAGAPEDLAAGPVLVRHRGIALGLASHHRASGVLHSLFPKAWGLAPDRSAF